MLPYLFCFLNGRSNDMAEAAEDIDDTEPDLIDMTDLVSSPTSEPLQYATLKKNLLTSIYF